MIDLNDIFFIMELSSSITLFIDFVSLAYYNLFFFPYNS